MAKVKLSGPEAECGYQQTQRQASAAEGPAPQIACDDRQDADPDQPA